MSAGGVIGKKFSPGKKIWLYGTQCYSLRVEHGIIMKISHKQNIIICIVPGASIGLSSTETAIVGGVLGPSLALFVIIAVIIIVIVIVKVRP